MSMFRAQRGSAIRLDFDLDPTELVVRELVHIEDYLEDTMSLALAAKEILQLDVAQHFATETDPDGNAWAELVKPHKDQQGILQLSGDMRDDAVDDGAWTVNSVGVFFDANQLPPYWFYHDVGSARIPRGPRAFIGASEEAANKVEMLGDSWLAVGIGVGSSTPMGMSFVSGYTRKSGRSVAGYYRRLPRR